MKFNETEITNAKVRPWRNSFAITFDTPITPRENVRRTYQHNGLWVPHATDSYWFTPSIIPDNIARAWVFEAEPWTADFGGSDMFGIHWEYEPNARGSIVRPGNPVLKDISQWKEVIQFPDVDSWDWEGSAAKNREYLANNKLYVNFNIFTGMFERMISFMDAGPALIALRSKKQQPYAKELLHALADLWIDIIEHVAKYYGKGVDGISFHDDWGAQDAPFFSEKTCREFLVPEMKRVTDRAHALGYTTELHSCGKIDKLVGCIVESGWDLWDGMGINDFHEDYSIYGEKLIMRIPVEQLPADVSEQESIASAQRYVDEFCSREKPCVISFYSNPDLTQRKEIYRRSRLKYTENSKEA